MDGTIASFETSEADTFHHDSDGEETLVVSKKKSHRLAIDSSSEDEIPTKESASSGTFSFSEEIRYTSESEPVNKKDDTEDKRPDSSSSLRIDLERNDKKSGDESNSDDDMLLSFKSTKKSKQLLTDSEDEQATGKLSSDDELLNKLISTSAASQNKPSSDSENSHDQDIVLKKKKFRKSVKQPAEDRFGTGNEDSMGESKTLDFASWKSRLGKGLISDESDDALPEEDLEEIKKKVSKKFKVKPERAKKPPKPKKDDLLELHSTSQRLLRNAHVTLPYHKPKCRTLDDFLQRKRVLLPESVKASRGPRLSGKDLELVVKQLEEREKEVEEFYKSESDSDTNAPSPGAKPVEEPPTARNALPASGSQAQESSETKNPEDLSADCQSFSELLTQDELSETKNENIETQNLPPDDLTSAVPIANSEEQGDSDSLKVSTTMDTDSHLTNLAEADTSEPVNVPDQLRQVNDVADHMDLDESEEKRARESENDQSSQQEPSGTDMDTENLSQTEENSSLDKELLSGLLRHEKDTKPDLRTLKLSLLQSAKNLTPQLKGVPGEVVCLDDDEPVKPGYEKLLTRFMKHTKSKSPTKDKKPTQLSIVKKVMGTDGKVQLEREIIELKTEEKKGQITPRLAQLKIALKSQMMSKREESRQKRWEEFKLDNEEGEEGQEEDMEEEILEDEESELEDEEEEEELEEDDIVLKDKKKKKSALVDDEAEESDDDANQSHDSEGDEDGKDDKDNNFDMQGSLIPPNRPAKDAKSRDSANDSFRSSEELGFLTPCPLELTQLSKKSFSPPPEDTEKMVASQNFNTIPSQGSSQMDELLGLCSGKFASATEEVSLHYSQTENISQLCSGEFKSQVSTREESQEAFALLPTPTQPSTSQVASESESRKITQYSRIVVPESLKSLKDDWSDDEADREANDGDKEPETEGLVVESSAVLDLDSDEEEGLVKKPKRKRRLQFSDDESDAGEELAAEEEVSDVDEDFKAYKEQEYESDDNQTPAKAVTKGLLHNGRLRKDFLENEAELSGSELGSDDEDERGLDILEEEEGDKEEIDEDELHDQVGRVHLKTLLDDDQREVRLLQEILLEDGDLHSDGKGRERKFRWRNMDDGWEDAPGGQEEKDAEEDEEAEEWRKTRFERERWIQENEKKKVAVEAEEDELLVMHSDSSILKLSMTNFKRTWTTKNQPVAEKNSASTSKEKEKSVSHLLPASPDAKQKLLLTKRGSFLSRGANLLTKMTSLGKGPESVSLGPKNSRNFTFAAASPEKNPKPESKRAPPPAKKVKIDRNLNVEDMSKSASVFKHF